VFVQKGISQIGITALLALVLLGLSMPLTQPSLGQSAKQRIQENRREHRQLWQHVKELSEDQQELGKRISILDEQIALKQEEIESIEDQRQSLKAELEGLEDEKQQLEIERVQCTQRLSNRARTVYMQGELGFIDVLLQAASFSDLIDRIFYVEALLAQDEQLINRSQLLGSQISEQLEAMSVRLADIEAICAELEKQEAELAAVRGEKQLSIEAITSDQALLMRRIKELEEENKRIQQEIEAHMRSASRNTGKWSGSFMQPVPGKVGSGFGMRVHPIYKVRKMHTGVDIGAATGTPIKAADDGKVFYTGRRGGYGLTVMIDHGVDSNGKQIVTLYAHMSHISCKAGDQVAQGQKIGEVGSTGISTGPHVHFEVRVDNTPVDPLKKLN